MTDWTPGRAAGLERLESFVPRAGERYSEERNFDYGPAARDNVSGLSPYLRHRLVTELDVLSATLSRHSMQSAKRFVDEVFWRTYFKGWLQQHPSVWDTFRKRVHDLHRMQSESAEFETRIANAVAGRTGIDCFDGWARELVETNYLHNHARMWFASLWIFRLKLPWELGADFFLRHLLDGDPASNTLGWRWVAGLHTRGKHYVATADNIRRFSAGRFSPGEPLIAAAEPLREEHAPTRIELRLPDPATATGPVGLLLTEDELCPETWRVEVPVRTVASIDSTHRRSPAAVSEQVVRFAADACTDARGRSARHFGCCGADAGALSDTQAVVDWAAEHELGSVVTGFAPVGPAAEALTAIEQALTARSVRLIRHVRGYDRRAWPHSSHGFFRFKKALPDLLAAIGCD